MADHSTRHGLTPDQVRVWVESSCEAQGLPVVVTEPATLSRVGVLLGGGRGQAGARPSRRSQPPRGSDPVRVQSGAASLGSGQDRGVLEDGLYDARLAG